MSRFLVTYHGGSPPANPEQAAKAKSAFEHWLGEAGEAVVDPGAPIRAAATIGTGSPDTGIGGYTIIEAPTADDAVAILKSHPFVARGGTLQVHEALSI